MTRTTNTKQIEEALTKINELDKQTELVKYKVEETIKDVERLNQLFTTLDTNLIRLKEQVEPFLKAGRWIITVVFGVVVTAILALVVKTS